MINSFSMVILDVDWDTHNVIVNLSRIILTHSFLFVYSTAVAIKW